MIPEVTERPATRAQTTRTVLSLVMVWVFLLAIVLQNVQRTAPDKPAAAAPPASFDSHQVTFLVTSASEVYTLAQGVMLPHVSFTSCPNRELQLTTTTNAPIVTRERIEWMPIERAYAFTADRAYAIVSSNTSVEAVFDDGSRVRLAVHCPPPRSHRFAMIFYHQGTVYLADINAGTSTPLFILDEGCELVWHDDSGSYRAYPWEMSLPLYTGQQDLPNDSAIAFSFIAESSPQLSITSAAEVSIVHDGGLVQVYGDCGTPLLPRR
jgi:hypothetical protein